DCDAGENLSESIALIGRQLNRVIQRMEKQSGTNVGTHVRPTQSNISKGNSTQKRTKEEDQGYQGRVQCHEYEGYGHIKSECPTFNKRKAPAVSWSDGDTDSEDEHVSAKCVRALSGVCGADPTTEISYEELSAFYKQAYEENQDLTRRVGTQQRIIDYMVEEKDGLYESIFHLKDEKENLLADMEDLEIEVSVLKYKLESIRKDLIDERPGERFSIEKLTLDPHKKTGQKL
ncbi:gag-pol polyprotein, partial [Trifolium medium]|nr:gag-pol polyprotein [Trifolium medium]